MIAAAVAAAACSGAAALARTRAGDERAAAAVVRAADLPPGWRAAAAVSLLPLMPDLSAAAATGFASSTWFRRGVVVRSTVVVLRRPADAARALAEARRYGPCAASLLAARRARRVGAAGYRIAVDRPAEAGADTVELWYLGRSSSVAAVELVSGGVFDGALRTRILRRVAARLAAATARR